MSDVDDSSGRNGQAVAPATQRSLVVMPQWLGDAIMAEPLVRALKQAGHQVSLAAMPWVAPICHAFESADEVITLPLQRQGLQFWKRRAIAHMMRGRFDRAWVLPNSFKSALLPWMARIPQRLGYQGESRGVVLTRNLPNPSKHQRSSMVLHYLALAQQCVPDELPQWALRTDEPLTTNADSDERAPHLHVQADAVANWWRELGVPMGQALVIAPGAEYGPAKRWPERHLVEVITRINQPVILMGAAKERPICDVIVSHLHERVRARVHNLAGKTDLSQALLLVAGAQQVLSNDSGVMHMAAAFGVPQVAIFGSSSPLHTPPLNVHAQVIWLKDDPDVDPPLRCAPCFDRTCKLGHTRCLTLIEPERVIKALSA